MAKLSIIMPVLNGGDLFIEAFKSVTNQSLQDIEIVVVDGGSTDSTLNFVYDALLEDNRIKVIHSKQKSMGKQYNLGIENATGEYVGFCEADDYLARDFLEKIYYIAKEDYLDYVRSDFDLFVDKEERIFLRHHVLGKKDESLYGCVINPKNYSNIIYTDVNMWNGIYRRDFLIDNHIKLNESPGAAFQDMGFVIQTIMFGEKVKYVSIDSYYYRQDNVMSSVYNPNVLSFVNQQAEYAIQYTSKLVNTEFGAAVQRRIINMFLGTYRMQIKNQCDEEILQKRYNEFRNLLDGWMKQMDSLQLEVIGIRTNLEMQLLLDNWKVFHLIQRKICYMNDSKYESLFEEIRRNDDSVIIGSGRIGSGCYGMLRNHNINSVRCFGDNAVSKQGVDNMGLPVYSVENAIREYPNALYIIATGGSTYDAVCRQLLSSGIQRNNIIRGYSPGTHLAFEIKVRMRDGFCCHA